jgi:hypothetical protein
MGIGKVCISHREIAEEFGDKGPVLQLIGAASRGRQQPPGACVLQDDQPSAADLAIVAVHFVNRPSGLQLFIKKQ